MIKLNENLYEVIQYRYIIINTTWNKIVKKRNRNKMKKHRFVWAFICPIVPLGTLDNEEFTSILLYFQDDRIMWNNTFLNNTLALVMKKMGYLNKALIKQFIDIYYLESIKLKQRSNSKKKEIE